MSEQEVTHVIDTITPPSREAPFGVKKTTVVKTVPSKDYPTKKAIFRAYQVIWYILGVIEVVLAFRVILKLVGANAYSGFTMFIYGLSQPFAQPFAGILSTSDMSDMTMEWSTIIAMIVYAVIAYGLVALFQILKPTNPQEVTEAVDNQV